MRPDETLARSDPSPEHPRDFGVMDRMVEHAGVERSVEEWWTRALAGAVASPELLADALVEALGARDGLMAVWLTAGSTLLNNLDRYGIEDPIALPACSIRRRVFGRIVRKDPLGARDVLDAWCTARLRALDAPDVTNAVGGLSELVTGLALFGGDPPPSAAALFVAAFAATSDSRQLRLSAAYLGQLAQSLPEERGRLLIDSLETGLREQVELHLARVAAVGRLFQRVWDADGPPRFRSRGGA